MSETALERLQQHAQSPRNMGRMGDANGIGNVGSIVVGRALRWFLNSSDGVITEAKFQVFACPEMVASASVLSELCVGKSLAEAADLSEQDLCTALGGLERKELPLVSWPLVALRLAVAAAGGPASTLAADVSQDPLLCRCYGVTTASVRAAVEDLGADASVDSVMAATAAGTGCGTCRRDIEQAIADTQAAAKPVAVRAAPVVASGRVALLKRVHAAADAILSEAAGAIELWDLTGAKVKVKADDQNPAISPLLDRLQRTLQDEVDPVLQIEIIAD